MNAIPRAATATIAIDPYNLEKLQSLCGEWKQIYEVEYLNIEDEFKFEMKTEEGYETRFVFSEKSKYSLLNLFMILPNSIQSMSFIVPGLVESSLNLGVLTTTDESVIFESAIRSSVPTRKEHILFQLKTIAEIFHAKLIVSGEYPAWPPTVESKLRTLFIDVYRDVFGKEMKTGAIHAGVECGIFQKKIEGLDMISFGPNMYDVHTPRERLSISSTERIYDLLLAVLEKMDQPL